MAEAKIETDPHEAAGTKINKIKTTNLKTKARAREIKIKDQEDQDTPLGLLIRPVTAIINTETLPGTVWHPSPVLGPARWHQDHEGPASLGENK